MLKERIDSLISSREDLNNYSTQPQQNGNKFQRLVSDKSSVISGDSDKKSNYSLKKRKKKPQNVDSEKKLSEIKNDKIISEEISETGTVKLSVYWSYVKSSGIILMFIFLLFFVMFNVASLLSNFWLTKWTNDPIIKNSSANSSDYESRQMSYLGGYAGFGLLQAIFVLVYALVSAETNVKSSRVLHQNILSNVLKSPMSFFDTTPIGRILNRFSKDIETVDNTIMQVIRSWLGNLFNIAATIIVIGYTTPIFLAVVIPVFILYYFVQRFYIPTTRQLKRLESTTRSPIYIHFSETIAGANVIRAFNKQEDFIEKSQKLVDRNLVAYFANITSNRWLSIILDCMGGIIVVSAAVFAVLGRESLSSSIVGLSISYALQITVALTWIVRMGTQLESSIVSVERLKEYSEIPNEADWYKGSQEPPPRWPVKYDIKFQNYGLRYRPGLDLVLKNINLDVNPKEKVGIVGRTGAGKSSITLALFRLIEPSEGSIVIDGLDISSIGLHQLRSKLTILPQDPVLFSGSLRSNLDPTNKHSDDELWRALDQAHLKTYVASLPDGLDNECGEGGQNLSVGQRQLVCLGRALLHKTGLLVLDEATAAVDLETDKVIQETIRTQFDDCTVLTIAHRINTILDCDRVLVMDNGKVMEFENPQFLLNNKKSLFYSLAKDARIVA